MEIIIEVKHKDEKSEVRETRVIEMELYDSYSYPEDVLHAIICEMRGRVEKEIPLAEQRGKELRKKILTQNL